MINIRSLSVAFLKKRKITEFSMLHPHAFSGDPMPPPNTLSPSLLLISDFVVSSRLGHPLNALLPIAKTLCGMVIEVRISQEENASSAIVVTLGGMVMEVKLEQPENAEPPIAVTLGGMVTKVRLEHMVYLQLVVYQFVLIKTIEK